MFRILWQYARHPWVACASGASLPMLTSACDTGSPGGKQQRPAIYMTTGPSGAGKDTLLLHARAKLKQDGDVSVEFVKRAITRDADKVTDLEIPVTLEEFQIASARGDYAIEYFANHTHYAIPRAALEAGIASKKRLVLNVSRTVIDKVLEEYGEQRGVEVYCLNITASEKELKRRLLSRGRESAEEIEERIIRAKLLEPRGSHVINIVNEASKEEGRDLVTNALTGKMKYSLWLVPSQQSLFHVVASKEIENLAISHGMQPFAPHITIGKSFIATQSEAVQLAQAAARAVGAPVQATPLDVSVSTSAFFRAAVLEIKPTDEIRDAYAIIRYTTPADADKPFHEIAEDTRTNYAPHVSFLYGRHDTETLKTVQELVRHSVASSPCLSSGFLGEELVLMMTTGGAYHCWTEVARFSLCHASAV